MSEFQVITQSVVNLTVTSSITSFSSEKRFPKDLSIAALKSKLELLTGCNAASVKLELYSKENKLICTLDNNEALLGSYPADDGMRLHVIDKTVNVGEYEDVSKVEKFELSADDYSKRTDSVKSFLLKNKMGKYKEVDPEEEKKEKEEQEKKEREEKEKAESMKIGDRCEVVVKGNPTRRATVEYVGVTDFKPGYWIGVRYDEPFGKNDGSVGGKRYFQCKAKYGGFVKPLNVTVGDFPEEDFGFDDDDEM